MHIHFFLIFSTFDLLEAAYKLAGGCTLVLAALEDSKVIVNHVGSILREISEEDSCVL